MSHEDRLSSKHWCFTTHTENVDRIDSVERKHRVALPESRRGTHGFAESRVELIDLSWNPFHIRYD
jgi:hypothetical protein